VVCRRSTAMDTPIETEVKIRFPGSPDDAYKLIEQFGYTLRIPRTLEVDQLFDRPDSSLRAADQVLRLRLDSNPDGKHWILTYKGPAQRERYKSREEIETGVADGDILALVLNRLGYTPSFRYEKYRTTFGTSHQPGIITVDETPLGIFLELEGRKEWIDETATHLGFSASDYVITSYAGLWQEYLRGRGNAPIDMVFLDYTPGPDK
jgi:adenylate cyclase class 2